AIYQECPYKLRKEGRVVCCTRMCPADEPRFSKLSGPICPPWPRSWWQQSQKNDPVVQALSNVITTLTLNAVKSAVQMTLAPGTRPPQSRLSLRRKSCDISYYVIAIFLAARGQCCRTKPTFRFRFLLVLKIIFNNMYPISRGANQVISFTSAF
ncbi:hypothetical protein IscW_ISCW007628, partial [Ixodes scapularis]